MGCVTPKNKDVNSKYPAYLEINKRRSLQGVKELKKVYKIDDNTVTIGQGVFGKVYKTTSLDDPTLWVAIKVIEKSKVKVEMIMQELAILNKINHPNIVNHIEDYVDEKNVYIGKFFKLHLTPISNGIY